MGPIPAPDRPVRPRRRWRHPPRSRAPLRRRLRQDPAAVRHWLLVGVLAWLLAALVSQTLGRAEAARARWGRTTVVWVADRSLRPGDALGGALHRARWPAALVPASVVQRPPAAGRAAIPVDAGSVLTPAMVEARRTSRRTVAVPLPASHLDVEEGDRVDVWAAADPSTASDGAAPARRVATGARVVRADRDSVVLAVAPSQIPALTAAAATATVALVGGP